MKDALALALFLKEQHLRPQQVQDFYPTPGTISTAMFYTELDPYTLNPVFVPKTKEEKAAQRAMLQYFRPENYDIVRKALVAMGRRDLIGTGKNCLVPPLEKKPNMKQNTNKNRKSPSKKNSHQWHGPSGKRK
jgi:hypothetical protein